MSTFSDAIASENMDLVKELLQAEIAAKTSNICRAVAKGNIEILQAFIEKWPIDHESMAQVLLTIPFVDHEEAKKLEILKCLLPFYCAEEQYSSIPSSLPRVILCYFTEKHFHLEEFLINEFYSWVESDNSIYLLIKKLQATVDGWHHFCIFLHDVSDHISALDMHGLAGIFLQLLLRDTHDSMELAVETFQVLLNKNLQMGLERNRNANNPTEIKQALNDPLIRRLIFQLIHNSMNEDTEQEIYRIMENWLINNFLRDKDIYNLSIQLLSPFINKPIPLVHEWSFFEFRLKKNGIRCLKELSQDIIRCQVFRNVSSNVKEFMDLIWSLNLPVTLKCFLLHIPDPSYMNTLKMS